MDPAKLSNVARKLFSQIEFDKDEQLIYEIRKHPIGLVFIYLMGFSVAAIMFVIFVLGSLFVDSFGFSSSTDSVRAILVLAGVVLTLLTLAMTALGAYLYQSNVVLVTNEKLAQVLYKNLFDRTISQLSIGDVQDVTIVQKGIMARIFDYGTLTVETAGEQQNYTFTFTPKPYYVGKAIVGAHEANLKEYGN